MISIIRDVDAYKKFLDSLPELVEDEVYMLILAARNKYLTEDQKLIYKLGNSCVLNRQIIKDKNKESGKVLHYIFDEALYTDTLGNPIPENCYTLYITVNPRSMIKAMHSFLGICDMYTQEYMSTHDVAQVVPKFKNLYQVFNSEIQNKRGTKTVVDIDFDLVSKSAGIKYLKDFLIFLQDSNCVLDSNLISVVETHGGYHLILRFNSLTPNAKRYYWAKIQELQTKGIAEFGDKFEIFQNKQDMTPVPGSLQGGFLVHEVPVQNILSL